MSVTDVRKQSDLSDYAGELRVDPSIRITDDFNGTSGTESGTTADLELPVTTPCATTMDATIGSTCSIATTFNAIVPNAVVESKRAIWQLGQVHVYDGGADGQASTSADNTLFMNEGLFAP